VIKVSPLEHPNFQNSLYILKGGRAKNFKIIIDTKLDKKLYIPSVHLDGKKPSTPFITYSQ